MTEAERLAEEELLEIERRATAATGGAWKAHVEGRDFTGGASCITTSGDDLEISGATNADYDFIAHARQDVPRLVAEIRRLQSLLNLPQHDE